LRHTGASAIIVGVDRSPLPDVALAVRPGEHACCRLSETEDRERLAVAFVREGLRRGHRVLYVPDGGAGDARIQALAASDPEIMPAVASGQLDIRSAHEVFTPGGGDDAARVLALVRDECDRAIADGYAGLSTTWDMGWALSAPSGLAACEQGLGDVIGSRSVVLLCRYDHGQFPAGTLADVASAHTVDVSPELAAIGRDGCLSAARVGTGRTLRLAGELDHASADVLASVLEAHFHGTLRLDLADLRYVDVSGMRVLRGRKGQRLEIVGASRPVRRLLSLLAWDTDPGVAVATEAARTLRSGPRP
jgi:anti-anti-sigma factor